MEQWVVSFLFLLIEMATCFSAIVFVASFWRKNEQLACDGLKQILENLIEVNQPSYRLQDLSQHPPKEGRFSVDVFVPTLNEDCGMLELTLQHCIAMDYPHQTWLLDDGNRAAIKSLAENLGVNYLARDKHAGAKAGNLNHAMLQTHGELIAIFDADFRPEKDFLEKLVACFHDQKVAIAQAPQSYYNIDSFQHRQLGKNVIYSDQDTFMHLVLPARNNWNVAYWIGTNALLRRAAIESIGGL